MLVNPGGGVVVGCLSSWLARGEKKEKAATGGAWRRTATEPSSRVEKTRAPKMQSEKGKKQERDGDGGGRCRVLCGGEEEEVRRQRVGGEMQFGVFESG